MPTAKNQRPTTTQRATFPLPSTRISFLNCGIVSPFPPSNGCHYLLTVDDHFSRWSEAFPMHDQKAETMAKTLFDAWISRFRAPYFITMFKN
ncbi:transposon Ty3-G Gag-Pol polyprotein [Trichonephila clavata]|uniref:Transposon Ty3-G Gag-Pol polyprotein n=1 Tax=Trichonephila clavata TaxID=2740835 RepID=A0A8X6FL85_TRICU|nr:transposon Ty3-G Gag-Pol polyprotein [Trichonephila clavata]